MLRHRLYDKKETPIALLTCRDEDEMASNLQFHTVQGHMLEKIDLL